MLLEDDTENDTPKRQKLETLSDSSSLYDPPNLFTSMVGDFSSSPYLYKSICQEFWNNGKECKSTQELVFINERMAVLYCLKRQMQKEVCQVIVDAMGGSGNSCDWLLLDTEYLKMCLEEMNAICERERFGTSFRVEREISIHVCPPAKLYPFLIS